VLCLDLTGSSGSCLNHVGPLWLYTCSCVIWFGGALILCTANGNVDLVQRRRTMNQEWNTFFDSHLYDGRVIHMLVMDQHTKMKLADVQVGVHILANYCRLNDDEPVELPVSLSIFNERINITVQHVCSA